MAQFPVSADIQRNLSLYIRSIEQARQERSEVVVFSEASLSGYGGVEWKDWRRLDFAAVDGALANVRRALKANGLWAIVGTTRRNAGAASEDRPYNAAVTIDSKGLIRSEYRKVFCTPGDLKHYAPGDSFPVTTIRGIKTGCLLCYDCQFAELYREYLKRGVSVCFALFYQTGRPPYKTELSHIIPISLQSHAAENNMYVVASNLGRRRAAWGSMIVNPMGVPVVKLPRGRTGLSTVTLDLRPYQESPWQRIHRRNSLNAARGRYVPVRAVGTARLC